MDYLFNFFYSLWPALNPHSRWEVACGIELAASGYER